MNVRKACYLDYELISGGTEFLYQSVWRDKRTGHVVIKGKITTSAGLILQQQHHSALGYAVN